MAKNDVIRTVEWALLMAQLPARQRSSAGVLLLDLISDELHVRLQPELAGANEDAAEFWRELSDDLTKRSRAVGGHQVLEWLETTASHLIQLGSRHSIEATNPQETLDLLYERHVVANLEVEQPVQPEFRRGVAR
jgi:hypothetical protein